MGANVGKLSMHVTRNDMHKLEYLHKFLTKELEAALPRIGAALEARIRRHVQSQDLDWPKLSESWTKYKAKHQYSKDTWVMTSSLTQSITHTVNKDELSVFVGVHRTAGNHVNGGPLFEIAFALEFGTLDSGGKIPPRPLFQPTLEESKRSVETSVGIAVKKAVKSFEVWFRS